MPIGRRCQHLKTNQKLIPALRSFISGHLQKKRCTLQVYHSKNTRHIAQLLVGYQCHRGIGSCVPLTFEEFFSRSLEHEIGPLVALGSPEDYVMPEGAARHYARDDDWKDRFLELISKASCIVTVVNNSSNLEWEYRQILQRGLQEKFFVFTRCYYRSQSYLYPDEEWNSECVRCPRRVRYPV